MLEFSQLQAAIPRRDRTDQYVILSALYCLGAAENPVTTQQISELLKLHLRKEVPSNLTARLREYTAYVDPAGKGPPLTWRLTPAGLDRLRDLSGLELAAKSKDVAFDFDIGLVCALED